MKKQTLEELALELQQLKKDNNVPIDMTLEAYVTIQKALQIKKDGTLETPKDMYWRVAEVAASYLTKHPHIATDFYSAISRNWLGLATPVMANLGTKASSLPISCFVLTVPDSVDGIFSTLYRTSMLSKYGGGVGVIFTDIREQNTSIKGGGKSNGAMPWMGIYDISASVVSQAGVRRGAYSFYIDIESADLFDVLLSKDHSKGDPRRHIHSNVAVIVKDQFMERLYAKDSDAILRWNAVLRTRLMSGSPYLLFIDNANRDLVPCMKERGKKITGSNICCEISSCADFEHDMVCCLASLNLARYDDWKDWRSPIYNLTLEELGTYFLDAVMENFIQETGKRDKDGKLLYPGTENARRYAVKGRPLGLGVFGYHAYLMSNMWPFKGKESRQFNKDYFLRLKNNCDKATASLAISYGEPEWCEGYARRNIQVTSIAPTVTNSVAAMGITAGIEPIPGNFYHHDGSSGRFERYNPYLQSTLRKYNKDTIEIWDSILNAEGSIQHLSFLTPREKEVFLTFKEIDQKEIVFQAAERQRYLDQTQSVNLSFNHDVDSELLSDVHIMAHQSGMHTLYYLRSNSIQKSKLQKLETPSRLHEDLDKCDMYVVISKDGCSWCDKALNLLEANNLEYEKIERHEEKAQELMLTFTPSEHKSFPIIFLGNNFIGGYQDLAANLLNSASVSKGEECAACSD